MATRSISLVALKRREKLVEILLFSLLVRECCQSTRTRSRFLKRPRSKLSHSLANKPRQLQDERRPSRKRFRVPGDLSNLFPMKKTPGRDFCAKTRSKSHTKLVVSSQNATSTPLTTT